MKQNYTSANTSINKNKLPVLYSKVDFFYFDSVLDYGCGKFNNGKEFCENRGIQWFGYDPYNRTDEENREACTALFDAVLCSNVLNVIDSDDVIQGIVDTIVGTECPYFFTVYEGNKSGEGCVSMWDCYQRNEKTKDYLRFFPENAVVRKGVITNAPELVR